MRNLRNTANKPKSNEIKKWCDFCDTCQEKEKEKEKDKDKDKDQDKTKNMILQTNNLYISTVIVYCINTQRWFAKIQNQRRDFYGQHAQSTAKLISLQLIADSVIIKQWQPKFPELDKALKPCVAYCCVPVIKILHGMESKR